MRNLLRRGAFPALWLAAAGVVVWLLMDTWSAPSVVGVVESPRVHVASPTAGTVTGVEVVDGGEVTAGQVLFRLETTALDHQLERLGDRRLLLDRLLAADRRRFSAELAEDRLEVAMDLARLRRNHHEGRASVLGSLAELDGIEIEIQRIEGAVARGTVAQQQLQQLLTRRATLQAFLREQRRAVAVGTDLTATPQPPTDDTHAEDRLTSLLADRLIAVEDVEAEIARLEEERRQRIVTAATSGRVVAVLIRPGESLPAWQPAILIEETPPRYVDVFVPEGTPTELRSGEQVAVWSERLADPFAGTVVTEGRTFDPVPERLQPIDRAPMWARHVRVQLAAGHALLPGERVRVAPSAP